ncbi:Monooxygenase, FAD-binding [Penicillium roqueforti FM164]|uniref:Monooxygenase, FAD-binding n=1 Tax=Penicillium roqueforti (strain FM164) TaxID=1365484 RepID=W6QY87_PENRF|nr:Monooxygenase, FAD-binding [Penicillium roqueforti FM164]
MSAEIDVPSTLDAQAIRVIIVGAGLGGLACAIACRRGEHPLDVTILERSEELLPVGAGIQLPPNATRVMAHFGLIEKLKRAGAITTEGYTLRRYRDGHTVAQKPLVIHRADYQALLLEEATNAGAHLVKNAEVVSIESCPAVDMVVLKDGRRFHPDMIIGADGLWSTMREFIMDGPSPPLETGDLAYRGMFSLQELTVLNDPDVEKLVAASDVQVWMGPEKHVAFYPIRNKTEFNLLTESSCPDDLPKGSRTSEGDLKEMRSHFDGWDPALRTMISCLRRALKWKLCHHEELQRWTKARYCDLVRRRLSSHFAIPSARGGNGSRGWCCLRTALDDGTKLRKERTETNVLGAVQSRDFYRLCDGSEQMERDQILSRLPDSQWTGDCKWNWGDAKYQQSLLGFDVLGDAAREFNGLGF